MARWRSIFRKLQRDSESRKPRRIVTCRYSFPLSRIRNWASISHCISARANAATRSRGFANDPFREFQIFAKTMIVGEKRNWHRVHWRWRAAELVAAIWSIHQTARHAGELRNLPLKNVITTACVFSGARAGFGRRTFRQHLFPKQVGGKNRAAEEGGKFAEVLDDSNRRASTCGPLGSA